MDNSALVNGKPCDGIEITTVQHISKSYSKSIFVNPLFRSVTTEPSSNSTNQDASILHIIAKENLPQKNKKVEENLIFVSDIIAIDRNINGQCKAQTLNLKIPRKPKLQHAFTVYYLSRSLKNTSIWCVNSVLIESQKESQINALYNEISSGLVLLRDCGKRPKRLFVIVNPYGGAGKGRKIWEKQARPLLSLAEIELKATFTERAGHAYDLCYNLDWRCYDGVVAIGGDGTLNECIHAFAVRKEEGQFSECPIPFGLIPGGSTNCVNDASTGCVDVTTTCLQIISGQTLRLDLISVRESKSNELVRVAFCHVGYGFLGDVLVRSEKLRFLGPIRYTVAIIQSLFALRTYNIETDIGIADVAHSDLHDPDLKCALTHDLKPCVICEGAKGSKRPVSTKRVTNVEADVVYVQVVANSCACKQSKIGISPTAHLGDGTIEVVFACRTNRKFRDALKMLLVHNSEMGRFEMACMKPYRASHATIKVPQTETSMVNQKLGNVDKHSGNLKGNASSFFSSSSTRSKKAESRHVYSQNAGDIIASEQEEISKPVSANDTEGKEKPSESGQVKNGGDVNEEQVEKDTSEQINLNGSDTNSRIHDANNGQPEAAGQTDKYHFTQAGKRENSGSNSASQTKISKPRTTKQMWINIKNLNALWNIDGEIWESSMLKLEPQCQFFSFFGARPMPDIDQKKGKADSGQAANAPMNQASKTINIHEEKF